MATRRIKEITNTATTFASDDFIALDGTSQGTRKMDKDDLIAEVSAGVSGDYLEEANNLSDVASLDTSKLNMEIPDVGTAPNEVPLSGQLGTMAFQDSAGVSVGQLEAETLTVDSNGSTQPTQSVVTNAGAEGSALELRNSAISADTATALTFTNSTISGANYGKAKIAAVRTNEANGNTDVVISTSASGSLSEAVRIDSSQRVGIGLSNPGDFNSATRDLVVGATTSNHGISIVAGTGSASAISFADSDDSTAGRIQYDHATNLLKFRVNGGEKWYIASDGNLVCNTAGKGINFGVVPTSGPSPTSSTLSDYEEGTWTPTLASVTAGPTAGAGAAYSGTYTKIGRLVQCSINLDFDDTGTAVAVDDRFTFGSLPFSVIPAQDTYTGAGSLYIYASTGSGSNAFGTVGITQSGDSLVCYITHLDGSLNYGRNVRAVFSYESDA